MSHASVEQGAVALLKTPSHVSIPQINQNDTLAKGALLLEKFISTECVRWTKQKCELCRACLLHACMRASSLDSETWWQPLADSATAGWLVVLARP